MTLVIWKTHLHLNPPPSQLILTMRILTLCWRCLYPPPKATQENAHGNHVDVGDTFFLLEK